MQVLPGIRFPEIVDWDEQLLGTSYVLPDEALADPEHRKHITPSLDVASPAKKQAKPKKGFG